MTPRSRPGLDDDVRRRHLKTTTKLMLIYFLTLIVLTTVSIASEPVIFEQFGRLVGSTSYVHVHCPLYLDSIINQHNKYEEYLSQKFKSPETIKIWLYEGLLASKNISSKTPWANLTSDLQTLMLTIDTNSAIYYEIGQLHLKDLGDIRNSVESLKNMLPQIKERPFSPIRNDRSISQDSYVATMYDSDGEDCDGDECVVIPVPFLSDDEDFLDLVHHRTRTTTSASTTTTTTTTSTTTTAAPSTKGWFKVVLKPGQVYDAKTGQIREAGPKPGQKSTLKMETDDPWDRFNDMHNVHGRPKRVAGFIALPIAIAATAMGLYNRVQIAALKDELFDVKSNTRRIFTLAQNLTKGLKQVENHINEIRTTIITLVATNPTIADARMTRLENQLRHRIMRTTHAVQSAILGRLAVDYLNPKNVNELFREIKNRATELGCELLIEYHTDLFQLEASLLFDGVDAHVLVHVPMAPKEGIMRLFRLHPFPLPLFDNKYLIPDVKNDILAISSTTNRLNIQLAAVDLLSCHRMNQLFLCDNFGVMSKKFNTTCLGALYYSMFDEAQKICNFRVVPAEENAYQIRKGEFIVTLPQASTINVVCQNGTHSEIHLKQGSQKFSISKGCTGDLTQHKLMSDYSNTLGSEIKQFDWEWDSVKFMDGQDDYLQRALNKLEEVKVITPNIAELRYLASVPEYQGSDHYNFGYVMTLICVVAIIIGICTLGIIFYTKCGCGCCQQRQSAQQRRGQGRRRRRQSPPDSGCFRRRRRRQSEPTVTFTRGEDTNDVAFTPPTPPRAFRPSSTDRQIASANKALEKRLSTLEKQYRQSREVEDNE